MPRRLALLTLVFAASALTLPPLAHAAIPYFGPIIPDIASQYGDMQTCPLGWGALIDVINNLISFGITLAIVGVAPLMIAYSGFLMVIEPASPGGRNKAKTILTNTIVGIVIALASWLIVDAVMAALTQNGQPFGTNWSQLVNSGGLDPCLNESKAFQQSATAGPTATALPAGVTVTPGQYSPSMAANYADAHALSGSSGQCALYVRKALAAGGLTSFDSTHPVDAKDYGPYLGSAGFSEVSTGGYTPQEGDVAVFQPYAGDPNNAGHIQIYDGSHWVSDFVQSGNYGIYPGPGYQSAQASYAVYRWPGS